MQSFVSIVMSPFDYGNAMLAGVLNSILSWLQCVLNAAARLVFSTRNHEAVSQLLQDLYCLRVPPHIKFNLADRVTEWWK